MSIIAHSISLRWNWRISSLVLFLSIFCGYAGDVSDYAVFKAQFFVQANSGNPVLESSNQYVFHPYVAACISGGIVDATVQTPSGVVQLSGSENLTFDAEFNSLAALNAAYPSGNYPFNFITAHFGTNAATLTLTGDAYPANAPHLTNFAAAQSINPITDFRLTWDPFTGATTNDLIVVGIDDEFSGTVFETPLVRGRPNFLNGTNSAVVLPAGMLEAGQTYELQIYFVKVTATNFTSIPGAIGQAGYVKRTRLNIKTTDVSNLGIAKGQQFDQTSSATPVSTGFRFEAFIDSGSETVTGATLRLPAGTIIQMPDEYIRADFTNQTLMDTTFPNGTYTMTLNTVHDGTKAVGLVLSGNAYPATTPRISNFAAAQTINSASDFRLTWDAFSGGTTNDFIQAQIEDPNQPDSDLWNSGQPGAPRALNGTNTFCVIPGGTLQPGQAYDLKVLYARLIRTNSYTNVIAFGGYYKATHCSIKTADIDYYGVAKGQFFFQTNSGPPVFQEYQFTVFGSASAENVNAATLELPDQTALDVPLSGDGFDFHEGPFSSQANLDAAFPNGSYTLTIDALNDGTKTCVLALSGNAYPLTTPHVSNFAAAQAIDPCADFVLTWDAWVGATTNDFVQFEIASSGTEGNTLFRTAGFLGQPGALNGTNTSIRIPRNTLRPGRSYEAGLLFARGALNTAAYPGVPGFGGYFKDTRLTLKTAGNPIYPRLSIDYDVQFSGQVYLHMTGEIGQSYTIEWTDDLRNPSWSPLISFYASDGTFDWVDFPPEDSNQGYYRVHEGQ